WFAADAGISLKLLLRLLFNTHRQFHSLTGSECNGDFATPKLTATDLPRCQALSADSAVLFGWPQCVLGLFSLTISLCPERPRPSHKAMPRQVISPTLRELTRQ